MVGVLNNHWIPACAGMTCLGLTQPTGVFQQAVRGLLDRWLAPLFLPLFLLNNHWIPACAGMTCLGLTQPTGVFQQAVRGLLDRWLAPLFLTGPVFSRCFSECCERTSSKARVLLLLWLRERPLPFVLYGSCCLSGLHPRSMANGWPKSLPRLVNGQFWLEWNDCCSLNKSGARFGLFA
jgi:hypothetical protein